MGEKVNRVADVQALVLMLLAVVKLLLMMMMMTMLMMMVMMKVQSGEVMAGTMSRAHVLHAEVEEEAWVTRAGTTMAQESHWERMWE